MFSFMFMDCVLYPKGCSSTCTVSFSPLEVFVSRYSKTEVGH